MSDYHELFDPSRMTDNDLLEKLSEFRDRITHAEQYGHFQMVHQMRIFIDLIETERESRKNKEMFIGFQKKNKTDKDIILGRIKDVDPDE